MSPCSATASKPCVTSDLSRMSTSRLRLQKTIALRTSSARSRLRSASRLSPDSTIERCCSTVNAGEAGGATEISFGLDRKDRKRVGVGKSVAGSVDIGGRRHIKKKTKTK